MTRHHTLLIALTFCMGILTGVFAYFWTHTSTREGSAPSIEREEQGYELLVTVYGGCERVGCASFRLLDDGSYQYLAPQGVRNYERYDDVISQKQNESIAAYVSQTDFTGLARSQFVGVCPVIYDGIAYRYEVRIKNDRYSLDSCIHNLENEPLMVELVKYFGIMEAIHGVSL